MAELIGFAALSGLMVVSALLVVQSTNLVHAVMWLALTLVATAGVYAMIGASFLAGVQVLLYVGGVITLMIFGVMITRRHEGIVVPADTGDGLERVRGMVVAGGLFGVVAAAVRATPGLFEAPADLPPLPSVGELGKAILTTHLVAFEILSLLLLAAMIGAIVIARRRDPGERGRGFLGQGQGQADGRSSSASPREVAP